jgi:hypothetical protein
MDIRSPSPTYIGTVPSLLPWDMYNLPDLLYHPPPQQFNMASDIDFLNQILEGEPTFQFKRPCNLGRTVQSFTLALYEGLSKRQSRGQYFVFKDIPYYVVEQLAQKRGSQIYHCRLLYLYEEQTLRIRIPCLATEVLRAWFGPLLGIKLDGMGRLLWEELSLTGASDWDMGSVLKMPDPGWGSMREISYITCVLEVGLWESTMRKKLELDARFWFEKPESHVQQVVTAVIAPSRPEIILQKWEAPRPEDTRPKAKRRTRSRRPPQARITQEARMTYPNETITVSGTIELSFAQLFKRPPDEAAGQGDILFTKDDLADGARRVWSSQNLIPWLPRTGGR